MDDSYPNQGDNLNGLEAWSPEVPKERTKTEEKEQAKIASSVAILQEFFDDLDADIEALRGIDIIEGVNPSTKADDLLQAVLSNLTSRSILLTLRNKYRIKYAQHLTRPADEA